MSDNGKEEKQESRAGAGQLDNYEERRAAYKSELQKMLASVPPGLNVGYLIAGLRKKYGLEAENLNSAAVPESQQGSWTLAEINKRRDERLAKEAEENLKNQEKAHQAKKIKDLKSRLFRAQFQTPRDFSWPQESRDVLRPFESAKDREIWACFSSLKILLREALASEFNLCGVEIDLVRFMKDARDYQGGEKQLLIDALSAIKSLLRILLFKPEPAIKPAPKVKEPVVKSHPLPVAPLEKRKRGRPARLRQAIAPAEIPVKAESKPESSIKAASLPKSEFKDFFWTNKFRRALGLKPLASNEELEKSFCLLASQHQRAIAFRFMIAGPKVSLSELMAGGLKRGVEELVKKAMEELRQKVLVVRKKEGVFVKSFAPAEPEQKTVEPKIFVSEKEQKQRRKKTLSSSLVFSPQNIAAWIKKVKEADSADIPNFFREISLEKLNKALLKRGVSAEAIGQILPLAEIIKKGPAFTLKQAKVFLLCFGEAKVPYKIIGEALGIQFKTASIIKRTAVNKLAVFLKNYAAVISEQPSHSQWLEEVAALDLKDLKAIEEFLRKAPFSKIQAALSAADPCQETIKAIALALRQPGVFRVSLNEGSARVFLAIIAEFKIPAVKIADKFFGGNIKAADNGRYKGLAKLAGIWQKAIKAGVGPLAYIESCLAQKKARPARIVAKKNSQLLWPKTVPAEKLELAHDVWTDRMLVSLRPHLGDLADLLVHPEQLAFALNFHNKGIAKDVFISAFSRSSAKTVKEIAERLGRTQKIISDVKTKLLCRISRRLQEVFSRGKPEEIFSAQLTPGFNPETYAALREKEAISRNQPRDEKKFSQKLIGWLATFGEQGLKRMAIAIVAQLKERGLEDWLLAELGFTLVEKFKSAPEP
ncbi:MAG: hypothetical protein UT31_C0037G0005, partial [Parcubacteria group bacterium GW2011_GWF2_39_13b]